MTVSISGNVKGASDKPLKDVVVKAVHEPTGSTFAKKTNVQGHYAFDRLKAGGPYVLSVAPESHSPMEIEGIHLKTEESLVQDFEVDSIS